MSAKPGRLIYLVGPSGAGKDSVMDWARQHAAGLPVVFAHRYITREPAVGGENHVQLSLREFEARRNSGLFALHWTANGLAYGVGIEIESWMRQGLTVVVNGSRAHLPEAVRRYPALLPALVTAPPEVLTQRLEQRGRESREAILARLERAAALGMDLNMDTTTPGLKTIVNDGPLAQAGQALLTLLADQA